MKNCYDPTNFIWEMSVLNLFAGSMLLAIFLGMRKAIEQKRGRFGV
jgi:hypothetical protein